MKSDVPFPNDEMVSLVIKEGVTSAVGELASHVPFQFDFHVLPPFVIYQVTPDPKVQSVRLLSFSLFLIYLTFRIPYL